MTMHKIVWIFCLGICLGGCKESCPGFPVDKLKWIPYELGDTLTFVSNNDVFQIIVVEKDVPEAYKKRKCGKCGGCDDFSTIVMEGKDAYSIEINAFSRIEGVRMDLMYNINAERDIFSLLESENIYLARGENEFSLLDTLIEGIYHKKVILMNDTIQQPDSHITRFEYVSGIGIVRFIDRYRGKDWKRIL